MDFSVYILQSERDGSFYIGQTSDLADRLRRHNLGLEKYTSRKAPWRLYWTQRVATRSEAIRLERKIKNFKSRARIVNFVLANGGPVGPVA
ncbi:MAG: GIY-YIG nuclease family protein [Cyclobacteriaceae bacterium]